MSLKPNIIDSIFKCLEKRDWSRYQSYLAEQERRGRKARSQRLNYQEFRTQDQAKYANRR